MDLLEKKSYDGPDPNCTMNFINSKEEALDIASRKNELSLSLIPTTPFKNLFDETPTPTRFLNAFETDMFPELNSDNPFDATFRKANSSRDPNSLSIPESSSLIASLPESEPLNTPSITLPPETPTIFRKRTLKPTLKITSVREQQECGNNDTMPFVSAESTSLEGVQCEQSPNEPEITTAEIRTFITETASALESIAETASSKTNVGQTPVITSTGNFPIVKTNNAVPTAVVVNRPKNIVRNLVSATASPVIVAEKPAVVKIEPPQAVVQSVCVTPMVQLMIRLPDGQTMPVNLPMVAQPATTVPVQNTVQVPMVESDTAVPPSIAKMKLKEVLTMNQKTNSVSKIATAIVKPRSKPTISSQVYKQDQAYIQPMPQEDTLTEFDISPPSSPAQKSTGRKRTNSFDRSPDEKQKRSRERNRAAATRCREKRKMWITGLERKAEELEVKNTHLQQEVNQLRNEVAQLKTMLLAHKDCPVTLQQKGMMCEAPKESYTTIRIVQPTTEDLQRVPNCSMSSPLNPAEYIEVEMSSVQSSDASSASDTSETSFKER